MWKYIKEHMNKYMYRAIYKEPDKNSYLKINKKTHINGQDKA